MRAIIVLLISLSFIGCFKKPIEPIEPVKPQKDSAYVWRQLIYSDNKDLSKIEQGGFVSEYQEGTLVITLLPLANKNIETEALFDIEQRDFLWKWKDYFPDARQDLIGGGIFSNIEYVFSGKEQYYLSLETGETLLKYRINTNEHIEGGCVIFGDKIFHVRRRGSPATPYEMTLYMSTKMSEEWQPVITFNQKDDYGVGLELPVVSTNVDGDTILFFQNRQYRYYAPRNRIDFYAYNMTKRHMVWEKIDISPEVSNKERAVMDQVNHRIFFISRYSVFCWDMETGEEIWRTDLDYAGLLSSDYLYHEGKLITVTDQGFLIAFDADTGQRLYYQKKGGCCVSNIKVHKDKIYYSDTDLFVSDLNTGKTIWQYNEDGGFNGSPVFDDEKGLMYIMSRYYIYALKIPE